MKLADLKGKKFDKLLVLGINENNKYNASGKIQWKCQCDCGNIVYKTSDYFSRKTQSLKACSKRCGSSIPEGTVFGRLTVLKLVVDEKGHSNYLCKCKCGNEVVVAGNKLKNGTTKSCGCYRKEKMQQLGSSGMNDITNQRFGKLVALEPTDKRQNKSVIWKCKCDCGNIHYASQHNLKNGDVTRCNDCKIKSKGEEKIVQLLQENGISFEREKTFESCRNPKTNKLLRFDFYVNNSYLIEFDGKQHYSDTLFFSENFSLADQQYRDKYKEWWCKENNIPLIRIPYTILDILSFKDIDINNSKFILR